MALPNPSMSFTPFDILTAAEMNDLVENDQALAAGTGFNTGAIPTAALANSAVTTAKINNGAITADKLGLSPQTSYVATTETRTNATYGALTTASSVTTTIGANGLALVILYCGKMFNNTNLGTSFMSFSVSGATTRAASDDFSISILASGANVPQIGVGAVFPVSGLTPGSTTFTTLFRSTGTDIASFQQRRITVIPI